MTANGWFQILLVLGVTLAVTKPLGIFMTRVFNREKTFLDPVLRPIEKLVSANGRGRTAGDALDGIYRRHAVVQRRFHGAPISDPAHAAVAPPQSAKDGQRGASSGLQHGRVFYHQYQLAEL